MSHNDSVSVFYGRDALKDAYNQSADGDVITLSPGSFNAVDFAKAITVRGAGMGIQVDSISTFTEPSILLGDFSVNAGTEAQPFKLEGVVNDATMRVAWTRGAQFSKCKFSYVRFYNSNSDQSVKDCSFLHCYVTSGIGGTNAEMNAVSCRFIGYDSTGSNNSWTLTNCVVTGNSSVSAFRNSSFKNCILSFYGSSYAYRLETNSTTAFYCLSDSGLAFDNFPAEYSNRFTDSKLFEDGTFCKLTDEAKKYLGDDGTEIGIYGGSIPFDSTPNYPQIKNFKVAGQTSETGTLQVEMEITQP